MKMSVGASNTVAGPPGAVMQKVLGAYFSAPWSLLLGRVTYENFAGYWPNQPSNPMSDMMNITEKFVASTTLAEPLSWHNSVLLKGDVADAVAKLKHEHPKTLIIFADAVTTSTGVIIATFRPA